MKKQIKKIGILALVITLVSCNKTNNGTTDEVGTPEPAISKKTAEVESSNDCRDKNEAIINWRSACSTASAMAGASNSNAKIWCSCVENKYDVRKYSESKYCLFPSPTRLFPRLWQDDDIIVQCGTANKPI